MSRQDTQDKIIKTELKKANTKRHWLGHKAIQDELGIKDLLRNGKRYGQFPIGFLASIGIQLQPKESILFTLILEETYNAGYIEWHYSQQMIVRFAQKYALWGLKDPRAARAVIDALHAAGIIINETNQGRQHSVIKICRGTFEVSRFEQMDEFRTNAVIYGPDKKRNPNAKRGFNFSTKEALIDLGCNTYANSSGLFNLEEKLTQVNEINSSEKLTQVDTNSSEKLIGVNTNSSEKLTLVNSAKPHTTELTEELKSSIKSSIKREEEEDKAKAPTERAELEERNKLDFINHLRVKYQGLPIVIDEVKYYFSRGGWLQEFESDTQIASGLALSLYTKMYKKRDVLVPMLDKYIADKEALL